MSPLAVFAIGFLFYALGDDQRAEGTFGWSPDAESHVLTVLHETREGALAHDVAEAGNCSVLSLDSGESLTLIVRYEGGIVASSVFEVECSTADLGYILLPRGGYNILLEQTPVRSPEILRKVEPKVEEEARP